MSHNSLYPGFTKIFYTVLTKEHVQTLPCKPFVAIGGANSVETKGDPLGTPWVTAVAAWLAVFKTLFSASVTFTYAELWTLAAPEADPEFKETLLTAVVGTNATGSVAMSQTCISGRTSGGGVAKVYGMETSLTVNTKLKPTYVSPILAVVSYLTGSTSWIVGRNGGFWLAAPQVTVKTNDTLRRQAGLE
jgi:hypothetical protein